MLAPKKTKMRKPHRPNVRGQAASNNEIAFGQFGLKAMTGSWVKAVQLEAARKVLSKYTNRGGKVWIRTFPHQSITNKGSQSTMGGGKGVPEYYVALIKPGNIVFEIEGIAKDQAKKALITAAYKLPFKAKFIEKN